MASRKAILVIVEQLNLLGADINVEAMKVWAHVLEPIGDGLLDVAFTRFLREHTWGTRVMPGALYQAAVAIKRVSTNRGAAYYLDRPGGNAHEQFEKLVEGGA